jgi:hypothetical protein
MDSDCGPLQECAGASCDSAGAKATGVCKLLSSVSHSRTCWTDNDCTPGGVCLGAVICPCDALCLLADQPGACTF